MPSPAETLPANGSPHNALGQRSTPALETGSPDALLPAHLELARRTPRVEPSFAFSAYTSAQYTYPDTPTTPAQPAATRVVPASYPTPSDSAGTIALGVGIIAVIAICAFVVFVLVVVGIICCRRRRRARRAQPRPPESVPMMNQAQKPGQTLPLPGPPQSSWYEPIQRYDSPGMSAIRPMHDSASVHSAGLTYKPPAGYSPVPVQPPQLPQTQQDYTYPHVQESGAVSAAPPQPRPSHLHRPGSVYSAPLPQTDYSPPAYASGARPQGEAASAFELGGPPLPPRLGQALSVLDFAAVGFSGPPPSYTTLGPGASWQPHRTNSILSQETAVMAPSPRPGAAPLARSGAT